MGIHFGAMRIGYCHPTKLRIDHLTPATAPEVQFILGGFRQAAV